MTRRRNSSWQRFNNTFLKHRKYVTLFAGVSIYLIGCIQKKKAKIPQEVTSSPTPYRRRVPIEIVEGDEAATKAPGVPKAETLPSTKRKGPLIEELPDPTAVPESNTPPKTFQQAKQERETRGPRKVGGGILKRDGSHSAAIFTPKVTVPVEVPVTPLDPAVESKPVNGSGKPKRAPANFTNAFEFQRQWQSYTDNEARWSVLQVSDPPFSCK